MWVKVINNCYAYIVDDDRYYQEMVFIKIGYFSYQMPNRIVRQDHTKSFYISKHPVSNIEFMQFFESDGYDIKDYWMIDQELMNRQDIGWFYQGYKTITSPQNWHFKDKNRNEELKKINLMINLLV